MNTEHSKIILWLKTSNPLEKTSQKRRKAIHPPLQFQATYKSSSEYRTYYNQYLENPKKAAQPESVTEAVSWEVKSTVSKEPATDSPKLPSSDEDYLKKFLKDAKLIIQYNTMKEVSGPIQPPMVMWGSLCVEDEQETPINFGPRRAKEG